MKYDQDLCLNLWYDLNMTSIWTQPSGPLCLWQCFSWVPKNYCLWIHSHFISIFDNASKFVRKIWMVLILTANWLKSRLDGPMDGLGSNKILWGRTGRTGSPTTFRCTDFAQRLIHIVGCWMLFWPRYVIEAYSGESLACFESLVYKFASLSGSWFYCSWVLIRTQWLSAWVLINTLKNPWKCWRSSGLQIVWTEWTLIG